ncbi:MAG: PAS domain S-box protein [Burkholderiales bacterium]|nr:PAS domain S-box protein [Burkholderiales bacterium]
MNTPQHAPWQTAGDTEIAFAIDRFCNFAHLGTGWTALTGWAVEEMVARPVADFVHPADRPAVLEALQSLLRREMYSCRIPARCRRQDGMYCWVEIHAHPHAQDAADAAGVRGTMVDITNRRKGMRALRESEARFRAICEASPLGVYVTDANGNCIFANANYELISGVRAERIRRRGYLSTVHPGDVGQVREAAEAARLARRPYRGEHRYVHEDATQIWSRTNAAPILDGARYLGSVHVVEDITAQRQAAEALRESQERLTLALEGSGHTLIDWDLHSGEVYLSEQWSRMVGSAQGAAVTTVRDLLGLVHAEDLDRFEAAMEETLQGSRPFLRAQARVQTRTAGWRWIEMHARVMERGAAGEALRVAGTIADITERKNFETRQSEFMATVSHELRTPLASVLGALEVLRDEFREHVPENARRFLDMALRNGGQLAGLINSVLDLERIEIGLHEFDLRNVEASALLALAMEANAPYAMKLDVSMAIDHPRTRAMVWTDADRVQQILTNLISNAVKFSPAGAGVTLGCEAKKDKVRLFVRDQGPGIPAESRDQIFQRFGQASNHDRARLPGSGLGLSICKALALRLGGDIGFRSVVGHGSVFWIDLPRGRSGGVRETHAGDEERHAPIGDRPRRQRADI